MSAGFSVGDRVKTRIALPSGLVRIGTVTEVLSASDRIYPVVVELDDIGRHHFAAHEIERVEGIQ